MKKPTPFILVMIAILHILVSWGTSIYCEISDGEVSASVVTKIENQNKPPEKTNSKVDFVKYAPYLSLVLSLPFEPVLKPLNGTLIPRAILNRDVGIEIFTKQISLYDAILLVANGAFFSAFVSFLWASIWRAIHKKD